MGVVCYPATDNYYRIEIDTSNSSFSSLINDEDSTTVPRASEELDIYGQFMKSHENLSAELIQNNTELVHELQSKELLPLGYLFHQINYFPLCQ